MVCNWPNGPRKKEDITYLDVEQELVLPGIGYQLLNNEFFALDSKHFCGSRMKEI